MVESSISLADALKFVARLNASGCLKEGERAAIILAEEFNRLEIGIVDALCENPIDPERLIELLVPK